VIAGAISDPYKGETPKTAINGVSVSTHPITERHDMPNSNSLIPFVEAGGSAPVSMSSREIADLVESRHDNVRRTIETLAAKGVITLPQTEEVPNDGPGPKTVSVYRVGKRDSYVIVAQLSPEFTARLVDRWQQLEAAANDPARVFESPAAMRGLLLTYCDKVIAQQAQLEAQAPKVAFADAVGNAENTQTISQVAKVIGIGPRKLFAFLRENGVLMVNDLPYQHHLECGRFKVIEVAYKNGAGEDRMKLQTRVTGKGVTFIQQRLAKAEVLSNV
jgi:anti-repressor protein